MATKKPVPQYEVSDQPMRQFEDNTGEYVPMNVLRETPTIEGAEPTAGELWEAAKQRHWLANSLSRQREMDYAQLDENFQVTPEMLYEQQRQGKTEQEIGFLSQAGSDQNYGRRLERIDEDRQRVQTLAAGGWAGTGMELLAGIADPVAIPALLATGGLAAGTKLNTARAVGMSMLTGMGQNVALEYALMQGDTQRSMKDVAIAGAAGALLGGTLTLGGRGLDRLKANRLVRQANEVDAEHTTSVKSMMEGDTYNAADAALATKTGDVQVRKRALSEREIMDTLKQEHGGRVEAEGKAAVNKAKEEFRVYNKERTAMIEKLRADKFIKPSARTKQIQQITDAITARKTALDERLATTSNARDINSAFDQLTNGKVPPAMEARYRELKGESGEFDAHVSEYLGQSLPKREVPPELRVDPAAEAPAPAAGAGGADDAQSMGAMNVRRAYKDIATYDELLTKSDVDEVFEAGRRAAVLGYNTPRVSRMTKAAGALRSLSSTIDGAGDAGTRGLGIQLFKNGTRTINGHQSAEELAETLFFRDAVPHYLDAEQAFEQYAASAGQGWFGRNRGKLRDEFDNEVVLAQARGEITTNVAAAGDTPVIAAAKARARIYEAGLKNNKDYGVIGFDKINHDNKYHSVIFDQSKILGLNANSDEIINTIARAYETGGIKLTRENAVRLATMQIERTTAMKTAGRAVNQKALSQSEFKQLEKELHARKVDPTIIKELEETLFSKESQELMSPRAMHSLKPNLLAEGGGVRMVDLIDTSIERVMKYGSDASANAGLASQGYRSRTHLQRTMEDLRKAAINDTRLAAQSENPKVKAAAEKELAKLESSEYQNLIDDGVSLMYKEPLVSGHSDALTDFGKLIRKATIMTRLRTTGLMTIPEYGTAAARNGAINLLSKLPQSRFFNLTEKSIAQDKFMNEFSKTFSTTGHQEYLFGKQFYNNSSFDDKARTKLGGIADHLLGKGVHTAMTLNLFRSIQHGGEEMVARAIVGNLQSMAKKGAITPVIRKSLIDAGGMSEDGLNKVIAHLNASPEDTFAAVRSLDSKLHNELSTAVRNATSASFMRMAIGEQSPLMHKELGKFLTSLLNFSIGSYEKMLVRGISSERALGAVSFGYQAALGYASYMAYTYMMANTKPATERNKYLQKQLSDEGQFWGTFNRVGHLAGPSIPLQIAASMRLMPESMIGGRTNAGVQGFSGIPAVDMMADYGKAVGAARDMAVKPKYQMSQQERDKHMRDIRRVIPFIDSPIYNFTIGADY